ncbi:MAG: Hpt domain-containing protein [Deltaproteobacteria bacterium]|nr:MAG: Hpt domain-containing protein [Deltaproteobacteria bacterium]
MPLVLPPPQADDEGAEGGADVILDPDRLDEIADGSLSLKRELVAIFLAELPRYEEWLREALVSGKTSDLERAGHALAGASANLALRELSQAARRLCDTARAGDGDTAAWIAVEVLGAAERARGALRRLEQQWTT